MLSPGSAVSRDSIISALINNFLEPELGTISFAVSILQSIYKSDLRAYFHTKPFYKLAGYMNFPDKVKEIYQNLEILSNVYDETVGFAALDEMVKLFFAEADNGTEFPVSTKFVSQLLSLSSEEVSKCLAKDHTEIEFKYVFQSAVNAKKSAAPAVIFSNAQVEKPKDFVFGQSSSRSSTPKSAATDTQEFEEEEQNYMPSLHWHDI